MTDVSRSFAQINQQSLLFNQPVSNAATTAIAAVANGLFNIFGPVGTIIEANITEAQFQAQLGNPSPATWVLADGRDVTGSAYDTATGFTTIPDLRGLFLRGKNNGRSDGNQNPDGELAVGTYTEYKTGPHQHNIFASENQFIVSDGTTNQQTLFDQDSSFNTSQSTGNPLTGSNETAPINITTNLFIRIN